MPNLYRLCFFTYLLFSMSYSLAAKWRTLDAEQLVVMTLPHGKVVFELAPWAAPNHVKQFTQLTQQGFYNGNKFYRVIDGFVAQAGPDESKPDAPNLKIEASFALTNKFAWQPVETQDMFAAETGFHLGFPIGKAKQQAWITHCPGVLAMARGNKPNTGSSHFYITIGQAPRYLDHIMTVFGRVVYGMDKVQAIQRTAVTEGDKPVPASQFTPIIKMAMMNDLPKTEQFTLQVIDTESADFAKTLQARRDRKSAFFYEKPPKILDVCQIPVKTRVIYPHS